MSLLALQHDFRDWLTAESAEAAARLEGPAARGLSVYLNTYRSQLLACLAEAFAMVRAWIGDAAFEAAAATHVDRVPPSGWTLDAYARGFPETLDMLHAEDAEIGELARLELALSDIFVGPDADAVRIGDLGGVDWDDAVLRPVPTFALLPVMTNAAAIWSALGEGATPPPATPLPKPGMLAIWRHGFTPRFRTLEGAEADALRHIIGGLSFGALCALLVDAHGEADGSALAGRWLGQWLADGLIHAIDGASACPAPPASSGKDQAR